MMGPRLGSIRLLLLSFCLLQHNVAAQRSTSVPFPSQSDSCNVVQVNCGGTQLNNDEKQEINRSPGSPGKLGPAGPRGPSGLKGEMGDKGIKGEKGKDVDVNLLKMEILKTLGAENCRELNVEHGVNASGYYIMRSAETGELKYHYCDFKIYQGVTTCDQLFKRYGKTKHGYYRFGSNSSIYHQCSGDVFTCHQLQKRDGTTKSGMYSLGKSGNKYEVYCDFYSQASTKIWHDSMTEMEVNCEPGGCYSKTPRYNMNLGQILQIINNSQNCRQYIKYKCKGSVLRDGYAWWVSRDGEKMTYWGQTGQSGYCTCGETGSCIDSNHKCNCDQNSKDITTQDEGFITDKTKLPVHELRYGDAGDSGEQGWHTLGQLECSG